MWARLRALDDPHNLERPADFNADAAARRFTALVEHLERGFGCPCRTDAGPGRIKDASFYGDVIVPADSTASGEDLAIRVSNFGPMAVYGLGRVGDYDGLDQADQERVETALEDTGYTIVPGRILWQEYDGRSDFWRTHVPNERPPTWWVRFFDYL
jgi:hypothetical protein